MTSKEHRDFSTAYMMMAGIAQGFFGSSEREQYSQCNKRGCWAWGKKGDPYDGVCEKCKHREKAVIDAVRES